MCSKKVASNLELARQRSIPCIQRSLILQRSLSSSTLSLLAAARNCPEFATPRRQQKCQSLLLSSTPIIQSSGKYDPTQQNVFPTIEGSRHLRFANLCDFSRFGKRLQELYESPFVNHGRPRSPQNQNLIQIFYLEPKLPEIGTHTFSAWYTTGAFSMQR